MTALLFLALIGATIIVVRGTLFERIRKLWPALLNCAQCTGFWIGAAAGARGIVSFGQGRVLDAAFAGCVTSVLSLLTDGVLLMLLGDPNEK